MESLFLSITYFFSKNHSFSNFGTMKCIKGCASIVIVVKVTDVLSIKKRLSKNGFLLLVSERVHVPGRVPKLFLNNNRIVVSRISSIQNIKYKRILLFREDDLFILGKHRTIIVVPFLAKNLAQFIMERKRTTNVLALCTWVLQKQNEIFTPFLQIIHTISVVFCAFFCEFKKSCLVL